MTTPHESRGLLNCVVLGFAFRLIISSYVLRGELMDMCFRMITRFCENMCSRVDLVSLEFSEDMRSWADHMSPEFCDDEAQRTEPKIFESALFDEVEAEHSAVVTEPEVEENRTAGSLAVVTSPLKPPIVAISSSTTTSFADPELAKFEAMDLDAQLDRREKLGATTSKAKSRAVDEAVERVRIWQSTELDLDENKEAVD
ncbi:hypothetical protein L3X38_015309 [Prunus dulcis]|uniref:Uncharacterized protein n=1 Tax=Prunus dulcis TaxID=3755 RepID=A0AAD4WPW2_PRUDU|nr:hypothetical protein L3X38_015309 [Prunus dulcis]